MSNYTTDEQYDKTLPHPVRSEGESSLLYMDISAAFHRNEENYTTAKQNICNVFHSVIQFLCISAFN